MEDQCPPPYSFELTDTARWKEHLVQEGFCVLRGVADEADVQTAKELLWRDIEAGSSRPPPLREPASGLLPPSGTMGPKRADLESWRKWWLPETGLLGSLAQSEGAWSVRGIPGVKAAFEQVWEDSDLIVSMDAVIAWRPWWHEEAWRPRTEGLHLDQNPFSKPGLDCVQGMMPLIDVTEATGGLEVVPGSHLEEAKAAYRERYPGMAGTHTLVNKLS